MSFVVRCRGMHYETVDEHLEEVWTVGYLDKDARITDARCYAQEFDNEADAWAFAATSGEQVPNNCWAEEKT